MELNSPQKSLKTTTKIASPMMQSESQTIYWYLEKISTNDKFSKSIDTFPFHIGRNENCELSLPVQYVSKNHAQIVREGKELKIIDMGSVNGTYVNRKKIKGSTVLKSGDVIHFSKLLDDSEGLRVVSYPSQVSSRTKKSTTSHTLRAHMLTSGIREKKIRGEDFDLSPGLSIFFEIQNKELKHIKARLDSVNKGISITLEVPSHEAMEINPEETCIGRFSHNGNVYGFKSKVINTEIDSITSAYIILEYPEIISYIAYRRFTRYKTNLNATIRKSIKDSPMRCKIIDISLGGCKVSFSDDNTPELNGKVLLSIENMIDDVHISKVHERKTHFDYQVGFEILYFGGPEKMKKYEEILHYHAPVWM
jgi:pSer/pThr/pTyr-binding forkhead associated (FHA) protein